MNRLSNYHYIAKHPSYSIWFTSQYPIPTGKIHNRIHRNPSPFTPIARRSTTPSSALSHVSLADDESSAWIVCLSVCPPGSQSRLHTQGNWKLFGNTVDRLRPVNSFIHQPRPRLSPPPPLSFPYLFSPRSARSPQRARGVLAGSGRPINPIRHGSSSARAAVLQFMNLLWAPPRIPRGLCYWFIVTLRRAPSSSMHAPGRGRRRREKIKLTSSPPRCRYSPSHRYRRVLWTFVRNVSWILITLE